MEKVSVIIPIYNSEKYIEDCVESLKNQTYKELEILLIDDGSTDSSREICKRICENDRRFKLIHQENQGVSAARNHGLEKATGKYVFFLDSDDWIHPRLLEEMVRELEKTSADLAVCEYCTAFDADFSRETKFSIASVNVLEWTFLNEEETRREFHLLNLSTVFRSIGGKMIRRQSFETLRFKEDISLGEDTRFLFDCINKGAVCVYNSVRWYFYRRHTENASANFSYLLDPSHLTLFEQVMEEEMAHGNEEYARMWYKYMLYGLKEKVFPDKVRKNKENALKLKVFQGVIKEKKKHPFYKTTDYKTKCIVFCFLHFYCHFTSVYKLCSKVLKFYKLCREL